MATRTEPADAAGEIGSMAPQSQFGELALGQCRDLLSAVSLGRVAWASPSGPRVFPVNFRWDGGQVILRTSPYSELAQLVRRQPVAFEVDQVDMAARTAWSVVVHGEAEGLKQSPRLLDLWRRGVVIPWPEGSHPMFIVIDPVIITGRYVQGWTG